MSSIKRSTEFRPGVSRRDDFPLRPCLAALLVVDIQASLSTIDDAKRTNGDYKHAVALPRMIRNTRQLLNAFRAARDGREDERKHGNNNDGEEKEGQKGPEVVFTYLETLTDDGRDISFDYRLSGPELSVNLPTPSNPTMFVDDVIAPMKGRELRFPKTSCSVFQSTNLHYVLQNLGVEQLVVCGQITDQCVESAVRDAADLGYLVTVVEDACAANSEECHEGGLRGMKGFARIVDTDQVLSELGAPAAALEVNDGGDCGGQKDDILNVGIGVKRTDCIGKVDTNAELGCASDDAPTDPSVKPANTSGNVEKPKVSFASFISPPAVVNSNNAVACHAAILRSLRAAGVKFLRYAIIDAFNTLRCKAAPIDRLLADLRATASHPSTSPPSSSSPIETAVSIAEVCLAGLPSHGDVLVPASNITAKNICILHPCWDSLRGNLPYAPSSAMVMCSAHDPASGTPSSPLCTRGLLERVVRAAREECGIGFNVGAEIEFTLVRGGSGGSATAAPSPVDHSTFANATTLNEQQEFVSNLYDQLRQQDIDVELIHAESAPGQMEVVIRYSDDAMRLADDVVLARETIRQVARDGGMRALFLPKVSASQAGNGMHVHLSIREYLSASNGCERIISCDAFSDRTSRHGMTSKAESFVEGILFHLPALTSLTVPSVNSFRRIGPGCWTGHGRAGWSVEDKEMPIRLCVDLCSRVATNVEVKLSDSTANIYLELAAILSAGMDGIVAGKALRPISNEVSANVGIVGADEEDEDLNVESDDDARLPSTFQESLDLLKKSKFLLSVLGKELSTAYIATREEEIRHAGESTVEEEVLAAFSKS